MTTREQLTFERVEKLLALLEESGTIEPEAANDFKETTELGDAHKALEAWRKRQP